MGHFHVSYVFVSFTRFKIKAAAMHIFFWLHISLKAKPFLASRLPFLAPRPMLFQKGYFSSPESPFFNLYYPAYL